MGQKTLRQLLIEARAMIVGDRGEPAPGDDWPAALLVRDIDEALAEPQRDAEAAEALLCELFGEPLKSPFVTAAARSTPSADDNRSS